MIPTSMCLVPQRPPGYHWSCEFHGEMSEELELESTRFSELDTQREQLEALIQGGNRIHRIRDGWDEQWIFNLMIESLILLCWVYIGDSKKHPQW